MPGRVSCLARNRQGFQGRSGKTRQRSIAGSHYQQEVPLGGLVAHGASPLIALHHPGLDALGAQIRHQVIGRDDPGCRASGVEDGGEGQGVLWTQGLGQDRDQWFAPEVWHDVYESFSVFLMVGEALAYKTNFSAELMEAVKGLASDAT